MDFNFLLHFSCSCSDDNKCNESDFLSENSDCSYACGTSYEECSSLGVGDATCADVGCNNGGKPGCTVKCKLDYSTCIPSSDQQTMQLDLEMDASGWETSWEISNSDVIVFDIPNGTYKGNDIIREFRCVEKGCHYVTVFDSGDDGIGGNYSLLFDGIDVDTPDFLSSVTFEFGSQFCTQAPTAANATQYPSLYPSESPSLYPTLYPSDMPSLLPSTTPTKIPSQYPSQFPTHFPSIIPSMTPSTSFPSSIPSITTNFEMSSPDPNAQMFGTRTALSQDKVFVCNSQHGNGAIHVFDFAGVYMNSLVASNGADGDEFGKDIAISDMYIVVGAPNANSGEGLAYVYSLSSFTEKVVLVASDHATQGQQRFGESVAISDLRIAVGAPNSNSNKGAVYMFDSFLFTDVRKILAPTPVENTNGLFGSVNILHNERIYIGCPGYSNGTGAVYKYDRSGNWMTMLVGSNIGDEFGYSIGAAGDTLIIGAPKSDVDGLDSGIAYSYDLKNDDAVLSQELRPADAGAGYNFGYSVAISNLSLITAPKIDGGGIGAVYLFDENCNQTNMVTNPTSNSTDQFGYHAVYEAGIGVVGAPLYTAPGGVTNGGIAYIVRTLT